jgi:hypothetical protein
MFRRAARLQSQTRILTLWLQVTVHAKHRGAMQQAWLQVLSLKELGGISTRGLASGRAGG